MEKELEEVIIRMNGLGRLYSILWEKYVLMCATIRPDRDKHRELQMEISNLHEQIRFIQIQYQYLLKKQ